MTRKKPEKIDVERALSESAPDSTPGAGDGEIEIVEVVGGEPGEGGAPPPGPQEPARGVTTAEAPGAAGREAELAAENAALLERLKRIQAEYENYRKRVERDRAAEREQANAALVLDLLPALDSFERALAAPGAGGEGRGEFRSGVTLIQRQLLEALARAGLEALEAAGEPFDPEVHEAVAISVEPGVPAGRVLQVFDRGYRFRGRLLRPARVRVSADPGGGDRAAGGAEESGMPH